MGEGTRSRTPIMETFSSEGAIIQNNISSRFKDKSKVDIKLSPPQTDSSRLSNTEANELADSHSKPYHDHIIKERIKSEHGLYNITTTEPLLNRSIIPATSQTSSDYEYNALNINEVQYKPPLKLI